MLFELSIIPLGGDGHLSSDIARILEIVDTSGLPYLLTPMGTIIEGEWDEVMDLIKACHAKARKHSAHVVTTIKIGDEEGAKNKLTSNVASVEAKVGKTLRRIPS